MEQDSYPALYGEPSLAVPSPSHMFQNATDFSVTGSRFINVQGNMNIQPMFSHAGVRDVVLSLLEQERQGIISGVTRNTPLPPAVYSESNNYCHQLLRQGRGFPMYVPSPQQNLPAEYRRTGIAIGDVGRVTPEGGFDFFFNIYRSASDPINANVPEDFVPLSSYNPIDLTHYSFDSGEYVSTPSVYDIDGGFLEPTPGGEFIFKCRGPDGAVLALPHGAHLEKLENLERMRRYAAKHAESWYRYVNETRGRGLVNGSLCLITGCEKSKSWGMASFQNVSVDKEFPLSFRPTAAEDNGYRYRWNGARCRHKQADPPLVDGTPLNQTTFIHAFTISLGEGLWGKLFGDVEVAQLVDSFASPDKSGGGFVPFGSQGSRFSWSLNFFGFNSNNGGSQSRTMAQGNTIISDACPVPQIFHPSRLIHERILREVPGATVVITHDDDWSDIFKDNNLPITSSHLQHMIFDRFNIVEEEGTVFLRDKSKNTLQDALTVNAEEPFAAVEEQAQDNSLPNTSSISPAVVLEAVQEEPSIEEPGANRSQPANDHTKIFGDSRTRLSSLFRNVIRTTPKMSVSTPAPDPQPGRHRSPQASSMPNRPLGLRNNSEKIILEIDSPAFVEERQQDHDAAIHNSHDKQNNFWSAYEALIAEKEEKERRNQSKLRDNLIIWATMACVATSGVMARLVMHMLGPLFVSITTSLRDRVTGHSHEFVFLLDPSIQIMLEEDPDISWRVTTDINWRVTTGISWRVMETHTAHEAISRRLRRRGADGIPGNVVRLTGSKGLLLERGADISPHDGQETAPERTVYTTWRICWPRLDLHNPDPGLETAMLNVHVHVLLEGEEGGILHCPLCQRLLDLLRESLHGTSGRDPGVQDGDGDGSDVEKWRRFRHG